MKTAALLENRGIKYFKVGLSGKYSVLKPKLRGFRGFRRIGLSYYYLPFSDAAIDFLIDNKFELNGAFLKMQQNEFEVKNPIQKIPKYKKLGLELRKFQFAGVNHIEYLKGIALIADVMGLGKTVQALAWLQYRKDIKKVLIVCPSSLKLNWQEEIKKWITRKLNVQILESKTPYPITGDIVIINYDILHDWIIDLKLTHFDVVIADELHQCKNTTSLRGKAFIEVSKAIPMRIGLTGTPIENDPIEIFHITNLLNKNIFPNYIKFIERYCDAKQEEQAVRGGKLVKVKQSDGTVKEIWQQNTRKIWKKGKFINQGELHRILKKHLMLRRTKEEVDIELPPKTRANIILKIDNWKEYREAEDDFIRYIKESFDAKAQKQLAQELKSFIETYHIDATTFGEQVINRSEIKKAKNDKLDAISRAPALAKIQALKILAARGKMKQLIEWISDFLLDTDEKLIVFTINKEIIKTFKDAFPSSVSIDGDTSTKKRDEAVKSFQNNPKCRLFFGQMKAAGIGLTLTAASKVLITQFPWNPGEMEQAEDRAHRMTQTNKVTIYRAIAKDTIEERILKLLFNKQIEIDKIIDGKNINVKTDLVKLLINSYR